jgi:hypothetical protein
VPGHICSRASGVASSVSLVFAWGTTRTQHLLLKANAADRGSSRWVCVAARGVPSIAPCG